MNQSHSESFEHYKKKLIQKVMKRVHFDLVGPLDPKVSFLNKKSHF